MKRNFILIRKIKIIFKQLILLNENRNDSLIEFWNRMKIEIKIWNEWMQLKMGKSKLQDPNRLGQVGREEERAYEGF